MKILAMIGRATIIVRWSEAAISADINPKLMRFRGRAVRPITRRRQARRAPPEINPR